VGDALRVELISGRLEHPQRHLMPFAPGFAGVAAGLMFGLGGWLAMRSGRAAPRSDPPTALAVVSAP